MSSINFLGSYSGIDQSMVDQLMAAEKMPLIGMSTKAQNYETEKNAWKDINTRMNTLSTKINDLKDGDLFNDKKFTSSESGIVSASVSNDAIEGDYKIEVIKLAKSTTLIGAKVKPPTESLNQLGNLKINIDGTEKLSIAVDGKSLNSIVTEINNAEALKGHVTASVVDSELVLKSVDEGKEVTLTDDKSGAIVDAVKNDLKQNGSLYIKVGDKTESISIVESDSLSDIVDKINESDSVSASIIDYKLVLKSKETGDESITLTDSKSGAIKDAIGMSTAIPTLGDNSEFTVNGITVNRSSNQIDDVVSGITFTLRKEATTTLTVSKDYSDLESKIQSVVDQYNSTMSFMQSKSKSGTPGSPGGEPGEASSKGDLAGDSALQRLISNLRTSVSGTISDITSQYKDASTIGIKTIDREGTLSFDKTKFHEAMDNDTKAVQNFFFSKNTSLEDTGFANKLDGFLDYYIDDYKGIISSKQTSLESMIDTVNDKMDAFNLRMEAKEAYYIKIFARLDSYMAKAESTTSYITSQMGAMNSSGE